MPRNCATTSPATAPPAAKAPLDEVGTLETGGAVWDKGADTARQLGEAIDREGAWGFARQVAGGLWDSLAGLAEDIGDRGVKPLLPDMANEGLAADKALVDRLQGDRSAQVGHAADSAIGAIELTAALATVGTGSVLTQGGKQAVKKGLEQAADSASTLARRDTLLDADAVRRAMEADHQRQMDERGPWVGGQPLSAQNQKAIDAAWLREVGDADKGASLAYDISNWGGTWTSI